MGKKANKQKQMKKLKKQSAVTFDPEERRNYLKGMIGAKKRRREHYYKKVEREQKELKQQERAELRAHRR